MNKRLLSCLLTIVTLFSFFSSMVAYADPALNAYSEGVTRGQIRYVSQNSNLDSNGWGSWAHKAYGECAYASQSMALSYLGKDVSPYYLCEGEYGQGKWQTYYAGDKATYEVPGIYIVSGSGVKSGSSAINTINSMLSDFLNDNNIGNVSPVVIHYSKGGNDPMHAIIVISKDSSGNYVAVDPWTSNGIQTRLFNISSSGVVSGSVTYGSSGLTIDRVEQYALTDPIPKSYLDKCTPYQSYVSLQITKDDAWLKSLPCSDETDPASKNVVNSALPVGTKLTGTALYLNDKNNYWYKVRIDSGTYAGNEGYVYAGDVSTTLKSNFTYSGKAFPSTLPAKKAYDVDWTISSDYLKIDTIVGYIYSGSNYSTQRYSGTINGVNTTSRNLQGTAVDNGLRYDLLEAGSYKTVITANATNYYSVDGKSRSSSLVSGTPISFVFQAVGDSAPTTYTVTFNANGGSVSPGSIKLPAGSTLGDLPTPTLKDTNTATRELNNFYEFDGWYTAKNGGTKVNSSTVINNDMTVYAHWVKSSFYGKVRFDTQGGSFERLGGNEPASFTYHDYETGTDANYSSFAAYLAANKYIYNESTGGRYRELPVPTKSGYVFAGWGFGNYGNYATYYSGFNSLDLHANWQPYDTARSTVSGTYNDHNYELFDYNMNWTAAEAFCESRGGHLVCINDAGEQDFIKGLINSCPDVNGPRNGLYHIGATKTSGAWSWVNGDSFNYNAWGNGEPTGSSDELYSAIVGINYLSQVVGGWIDESETDCNGFYSTGNCGFICEYELQTGTWGNLSWELDNTGLLTISGSGNMNGFDHDSTEAWRAYVDRITSIVIQEGVTSIGQYAFMNCNGLESVTIPATVKTIADEAFRSCENLKDLLIPEGVTDIGHYAFLFCNSLTSITIPSSITNFSSGFEYCRNLKKAVIQEGVTTIGNYAFYCCSNLADVTIPSTVNTIGAGAFHNTALDSVSIPNGVTNMGDWVFAYCSNLEIISIPSQVTYIPDGTFSNCTSLREIILPAGLVGIGDETFDNCSSLTDVYYGASSAEWQAISIGTRNDELNSATIHSADGTWGNLNWSLNKNGHLTISGNGAMDGFSHDSTDAWNTYRSKITSVELKNGITSIGWNAFFSCENLKSVTIPSSVTTIGNYAFSNCSSLNTVLIPSTVATLGNSAFRSCSKLQNLTISEGVTVMEEYVFCGCSSLTSVTIPSSISKIGGGAFEDCGSLTNVVICEGVKEIGEFAFSRSTNLSIVSIPGSVTNIERYAFNNTALKTVCFDGTQEQWTEISVGEGNDSLASAEKQYGKYTVAYDANGGINAPSEQIMARGTNLTISSTEPTRSSTDSGYFTVTLSANGGNVSTTSLTALRTTSYNFKNWNTEAEGYGTSYEAGGIYSDNTSVTLYAQWNSDTTTKEVHLPIPTRDGYSFLGWSTSSDSTEGISGSYYTPDSDITLYALWEENAPRTGTWGNLSWTLDSMGQLTISGSGEMDGFSSGSIEAWRAFRDDIKTITIMPGVTSIGHYAFYNCLNLLEITIPSGVECIGNAAIAYCARLDSIIIPDSVNSIGYSAFAGCGHLGSIVLPEGITSIENYTFSRCSYLSLVTLPESITSIGDYAFQYCDCIKEITIPQRVSIISDSMFNGCSRLSTITIPQNVNTIGRSAFKGCEGLTDIYFGGTQVKWNKIKKLPDNEPLLNAKVHFTIPDPDFILPTALTIIEEEAFASSGFVYAKLPEQVISIGWHAFADCPNLAYIYIPSLTTQIDEEAFGDLQGLTILGKTGSTSETYARNHNFNFIAVP